MQMFGNKPTVKEQRNKAFNDYERQRMRNEYRMQHSMQQNSRKARACETKSKELLGNGMRHEAEEQFKMMQMYERENKDIQRNLEAQQMESLSLQRGIRYSDMADMSRTSAVAFSQVAGSIHMKRIEHTNEQRNKAKESLDDKIRELSSTQDEIRDEMLADDHAGPSDGNGFASFEQFEDFMNDMHKKDLESQLDNTAPQTPAWLLAIENSADTAPVAAPAQAEGASSSLSFTRQKQGGGHSNTSDSVPPGSSVNDADDDNDE